MWTRIRKKNLCSECFICKHSVQVSCVNHDAMHIFGAKLGFLFHCIEICCACRLWQFVATVGGRGSPPSFFSFYLLE